jgi:hypothetical protein
LRQIKLTKSTWQEKAHFVTPSAAQEAEVQQVPRTATLHNSNHPPEKAPPTDEDHNVTIPEHPTEGQSHGHGEAAEMEKIMQQINVEEAAEAGNEVR